MLCYKTEREQRDRKAKQSTTHLADRLGTHSGLVDMGRDRQQKGVMK